MRKYYTRPCNFYYGNYAKKLIKKKLALSLTGNPQIAFDHIEIFQRKAKRSVKQDIYPISNIKKLKNELRSLINVDFISSGKVFIDVIGYISLCITLRFFLLKISS